MSVHSCSDVRKDSQFNLEKFPRMINTNYKLAKQNIEVFVAFFFHPIKPESFSTDGTGFE